MTQDQFIDSFLKIEYVEHSKSFGLYPYAMVAVAPDGKLSISALALDDVRLCYIKFREAIKEGSTAVHMLLDFPAGMDCTSDVVFVYSWDSEGLKMFGVPYDNTNGEQLPRIYSGMYLETIKSQLALYLNLSAQAANKNAN